MRRKGELSKGQVDREWPHQVALPEETNVRDFVAIQAFCEGLSLAPRGHVFVRDDRYFIVHCFAEPEHAERFRARWDGEMIEPKDRPRWGGNARKRA